MFMRLGTVSKLQGYAYSKDLNLLELFIQLALGTWRLTSLQRVKHMGSPGHTTVMLMEMAPGEVSYLSLASLRNFL